MDTPQNWIAVTESQYPWEREALTFIRNQFPTHEPYRAWANFEFIADDGSINEVDLLVCTPQGFFLTEIKSRPGRVFGDAGTWTWETDGRLITTDSPVISANVKAKKLRALLQQQAVLHGVPASLEPLTVARQEILGHDHAQRERRRLDRINMALRLVQWLIHGAATAISSCQSLAEAAAYHLAEGGFVDWARLSLRGGEPVRELLEA